MPSSKKPTIHILDKNTIDKSIYKFLSNPFGICRVGGSSTISYIRREQEQLGLTIDNYGYWFNCTIAYIKVNYIKEVMRVTLQIEANRINGQSILFTYPNSRIVDHDLIDEFLRINFPTTRHWSDGLNFHNIASHLMKYKHYPIPNENLVLWLTDEQSRDKNYIVNIVNEYRLQQV